MMYNLMKMKGFKIDTSDGEAGKIADFLFDDMSWTVRYVEVNTGSWLFGRRVLISPSHISAVMFKQEKIQVDLTQKQVENSPDLATDKPVSRQYETAFHDYYGMSPYWFDAGDPYMNTGVPEFQKEFDEKKDQDPHLRSMNEVTGYNIATKDDGLGKVDDLLAEQEQWVIRYLLIDTKILLPGKKVLVSTQWIKDVDWGQKHIVADLEKEQIKQSPEYDDSTPPERDYEVKLHEFYGKAPYWQASAM